MSFFNNAKFVAGRASSNPFMIYSRHADRYLDNELSALRAFLFCLLDLTLYFFNRKEDLKKWLILTNYFLYFPLVFYSRIKLFL